MNTQEFEEVELQEVLSSQRELVLHNDDYNTFEHVINCLVSICDHAETQAEQCAHIVHFNGKCSIKVGSEQKLKPMFSALRMQDLTVELK